MTFSELSPPPSLLLKLSNMASAEERVPWVAEFFLAYDDELVGRRPKAEDVSTKPETAHQKPLAPRVGKRTSNVGTDRLYNHMLLCIFN